MDYDNSHVIERESADNTPRGEMEHDMYKSARGGYRDKERKIDVSRDKKESDQAIRQQEGLGDTRDAIAQWYNISTDSHTEDTKDKEEETGAIRKEENDKGRHGKKIAICNYFAALALNACGTGLIFTYVYVFDFNFFAFIAAILAAIGAGGIVFWGCVLFALLSDDSNNQCLKWFGCSEGLKEMGCLKCQFGMCCLINIILFFSMGILQLAAACLMAVATAKTDAESNVVGFGAFVTLWEFMTFFVSIGVYLIKLYI